VGTPEKARLGLKRKRPALGCAGSTVMANAPSRIASSLIVASGVWETTQKELAVVDLEGTTPNHFLASWEAIVEGSGDASESNSCL